jgi:hypothetical protein
MNARDESQIDELRNLVLQLGNALRLSERRTTRLERSLRWGAVSLLLALAVGLTIVVKPFGLALAQSGERLPSKSPEEAIDRLTESLTGQGSTLGMMGIRTISRPS